MPTFSKHPIKTLISMFVAVPSIAFAASPGYLCHHGEQSREILVQYDVPGQSVPCGVLYRKASGEQELWRANDETGYCEARAREFAAKQESWGWQCSELSSNSPEQDEASTEDASEQSAAANTAENATEGAVNDAEEATSDEVETSETSGETSSEPEPLNDAANLL